MKKWFDAGQLSKKSYASFREWYGKKIIIINKYTKQIYLENNERYVVDVRVADLWITISFDF